MDEHQSLATMRGYIFPVLLLPASIAFTHLSPLAPRQSFIRLTSNRDFDFSSKAGWNQFYQTEHNVVEWHSSVALEDLVVAYIPPNADCLMVGCGNSRLPRVVLDVNDGSTKLTCLDSSGTCLEQLVTQFQSEEEKPSMVCGDAVELHKTLGNPENQFDIIVDKGLLDALLCGEGWNGPVERLMLGAIQRLRGPGSRYLLVSYRLPSSTMDFLKEVTHPCLEWDFARPEGNSRVQVSLATKIQ